MSGGLEDKILKSRSLSLLFLIVFGIIFVSGSIIYGGIYLIIDSQYGFGIPILILGLAILVACIWATIEVILKGPPRQNAKDKSKRMKRSETKINEIISLLEEANYIPEKITIEDLKNYFKGDAPSGDAITLEMVLESKWLLIHEIVECSELKKMGFQMQATLLHTEPEKVFQAHLVATEWELNLALLDGDSDWIKKRLVDVTSWLDDPNLSQTERNNCQSLLKKFN